MTGGPLSRNQLVATVAELLGTAPDAIAPDADLFALGVGSLDLMRQVNRWRVRGLPVSFTDLAAHPTLDGWWRQLSSAQHANPRWHERWTAGGWQVTAA